MQLQQPGKAVDRLLLALSTGVSTLIKALERTGLCCRQLLRKEGLARSGSVANFHMARPLPLLSRNKVPRLI